VKTAWAVKAMAAAFVVLVLSPGAAIAVTFNVDVSVGWLVGGAHCAPVDSACLGFSGNGPFGPLVVNWDNQTAAQDSFLRVGALPDVTGFPSGTGSTTIDPGQTVRTAQIQHENNVIPQGDHFLDRITLRTLLEITGPNNEPIIGLGTGGDLDVEVRFLETKNDGVCAETSNSLGSNCDDQFTFISLVADIPFTFDGVDYVLHVRGLLDENGNPTCEDAGNGNVNCLTRENEINNRFVTITLEQLTRVPAPASLLLVGLGLAGAGLLPLLRRRRSS
jgi:hypothetical protein